MNQFFQNLLAASVDRRLLALGVILFISLFAGIGHYDENLLLNLFKKADSEAVEKSAQPTNGNTRQAPEGVSPLRLDGADAVLVVRSDDFFTPEAIAAMRAVATSLEDLEQVRQVLWIDRMPPLNIFGLSQPLLPRDKAPDAVFKEAQKKAQAHPLVGGQMLSPDAKTMIVLIYLDWRYLFSDARATTELKQAAEQAASQFPQAKLSFQVTGGVPGMVATISHQESNAVKFQFIGYGLALILAIILFRGIRAVVVVSLAPIFGLFWSMGIIQYLDFDRNGLVNVVVPVLVSLVALTDSVHLMVQIRRLRAAGLSEKEAARKAVQQVGLACFLTSLTTAIGFGSLVLAESEIVQEFGQCAVIGVVLSFLAVVIVIPLASSTWLGRKIHVGHENSLVDRNVSKVSGVIDFVMKRAGLFSALGVISTIALVAVSTTLQPDFRISNAMPKDSEAAIAMAHLDEAFNGIEFVEVRAEWNEKVRDDSAEILKVVTKIDELLRTEKLVGQPLSIRNMIDSLPGEGPPEERMGLIELLPPPLKRSFYSPEKRNASVQFRVRDLGIARYGEVYERLEIGLGKITEQHENFELGLRGNAIWRWENIYQIVADLFKSLGVAIVIIFLVLTFVYRSLRIGFVSLVPNLFPLAVAGAFLAVSGYNLEVVMVCSFTVCLGIAVDDTIHFLTRYQQERLKTDNEEEAIHKAFTGVGTALIMTTIVLVAGFGGVLFSDARDHQIFALMGIISIATALFADLVFLPALLKKFVAKK